MSPSPFEKMMRAFHQTVSGLTPIDDYHSSTHRDVVTMNTINAIYCTTGAINDTTGILPSSTETEKVFHYNYCWPVINSEISNAVEEQLRESVSIYDSGGIIGRFEHAWKEKHGLDGSFSLLHNSGTNALQALYFAAQLQPGDEVGRSPNTSAFQTKHLARLSSLSTASTPQVPQPCNLVSFPFSATLLMMVTFLLKQFHWPLLHTQKRLLSHTCGVFRVI